jgi:hypothetical protein
MSIWDQTWESLDELGGNLLDSAGGALADRVGSEIRGDSGPRGAEAQPDMMVEVPQSGPEQAEITKATVSDRIQEQLKGWLPWAGIGLAVVAYLAIKGSR